MASYSHGYEDNLTRAIRVNMIGSPQVRERAPAGTVVNFHPSSWTKARRSAESSLSCPLALLHGEGALWFHLAPSKSRAAAARASSVIVAPASIRAISSRRASFSRIETRVATRLPRPAAALAMRK
jgi:hypothetical protein